jgi:hypothetical protein
MAHIRSYKYMFKSGVSCQFSFEIDPATLHLRLESPFLRVTRSTAYFEVLNACASTGMRGLSFRVSFPSQGMVVSVTGKVSIPEKRDSDEN